MKGLLGVAMHQNQAVEHTALLDHAVDVGIKLHERRLEKAPSSQGQPHLPADPVEFAAAVFKGLVQPLVDGFFEGCKDETDAGAHEPVCCDGCRPDCESKPCQYKENDKHSDHEGWKFSNKLHLPRSPDH